MESLTIVSYNIKGLGNPIKRKKVLSQLKTLQCSIAMLQETHIMSESELLKLKRHWVEQVYGASYEGGRKRGVAILFNKSVYFSCERVIQDKEGRYIMVIGTIGEERFTFLNLYAPNEDCPNFFKKIASELADKGEGTIVTSGDHNCVLNGRIDRLPAEKGPRSKKTITALGMLDGLGLVDVWRHLHPKEKDYTFRSQVHGSYSRIDMICMSKVDIHRVTQCEIGPITLSDHAPVTMKMNLRQGRQFRYWRLNVSILNDPLTQEEIRDSLTEYFDLNDNGEVTPSILWDGAKAVMRGKIIQISSRLKKQREAKRLELEREIMTLEREHKLTRDGDKLELLKRKRQKLDDLLTYKAEGALRFVKRRYYESGNKASRLLAFQLRKAQSSRVVAKIRNPDTNKLTSQSKEIAEAFALYYKKLYEGQEIEGKREKIARLLDSVHLNTLTEEEAEIMCSPVTEAEIADSIGKLKNNKSPGVDGYSGEFYKTYKNELIPVLCRVYNYTLDEGDPPKSWSEAIITVIHKEGKDPTQCMGYRPISLLCQDLIILTSILADRIQTYIRKLVHPDQSGFITGRHGTNNVRRVLNIQSLAAKRDVPSMLLSLDSEKAFDRVDWVFLQETLSSMGFDQKFIDWIKVFYMNPKSRVRVNGHCSEFFNLGRGTRQGDALSPALFALNIEPLAELIRRNPLIQGIPDEGGTRHTVGLYADDMIVMMENPLTSIPALMRTIDEYGQLSGYKINANKSEAQMISGTWPSQLDSLVSFRRSEHGFRYLGVIITPKTTQLYKANYKKLIDVLKGDLTRWDILPLSLVGRIEAVKMNLLPRLLFLFQSLPIWIPTSEFNALDKLLAKFIWQNKRARVRYKTMMLSKDKGGLSLPHLRHYYWAAQLTAVTAWIRKDSDTGWVNIEQSSLPAGTSLANLVFMTPQSQKKMRIKNTWVKHTLKVWSTVQKRFRGKATLSRAMGIVGNLEFLPSITDIAFKRWVDRDLKVVDQLFDEGNLHTFGYLKEKFQLPQSDMFRYFQIRHYITHHRDWDIIRSPPTNIELYFINIARFHLPNRKHVSHIYQNLLNDLDEDTLYIKNQWELEMNIVFEEDEWEDVCTRCHKGINSNMWKEFDWKTKIRFFRTPLVVSKFVDNPNAKDCWRVCGSVGDHTHIFWDCPRIVAYWQGIKAEIDQILGIDLPFCPKHFIFELVAEDVCPKNQMFLLHILLMTARKMVTVNWMKPEPPTVAQWTLKLKEVYVMETLTAQLQLKTDIFQRRWLPLQLYLDE